MAYSLYLKKENFKFSSSHFTIFDANHAEALHGHNYRVGVRIIFADVKKDIEMKYDFNLLKKMILELCNALDEKVLIPEKSPYLTIIPSPHYNEHTEVSYGSRHYCFPTDEILQLPLSNITSEALARYFWDILSLRFPKDIQKIVVSVTETAGQSASFSR